jgi:hypothetical protein
VDVSIEPLDNPSEQDDKDIELKLLDDDDSDIYEIDGDLNSELVTVKPSAADISSICFRVIRQSPYLGRPIGQNVRANVWGSNFLNPSTGFYGYQLSKFLGYCSRFIIARETGINNGEHCF